MKRLKLLIASLLVSLGTIAPLAAQPAYAAPTNGTSNYDIITGNGKGVDCSSGAIKNSAVCAEHQNKDNPLTGCPSHCGKGVLYSITNLIAYIAGGAAIIMMIYGAFRFATSGSDMSTNSRTDTDVEDAKRAITNAIIGLVIIVAGKVLIDFVLSKI